MIQFSKPIILSVINSGEESGIMSGNFYILPWTHPYCLFFQNKNATGVGWRAGEKMQTTVT